MPPVSPFNAAAMLECDCVASMAGGFTGNGEWRQVAENADSPLESSMSFSHGIHTFQGLRTACREGSHYAARSRPPQGGIGRFRRPRMPFCSDAGWIRNSLLWYRLTPFPTRNLEKIPPPEFPRESILKIDKRGLETGFPTAPRPLSKGMKTGCGVNFSGRKIPP